MYKILGNKHFKLICQTFSKPIPSKLFDYKDAQRITNSGKR